MACNAISKDGPRMLICELELHHDGDHADGDTSWEERTFQDGAGLW